MASQFSERPDPQAPLRHLPAIIIVCFWVFQAIMSSISLVLMGEPGFGPFLVPRGIVDCASALISVVILKIHERHPGKPLAKVGACHGDLIWYVRGSLAAPDEGAAADRQEERGQAGCRQN